MKIRLQCVESHGSEGLSAPADRDESDGDEDIVDPKVGETLALEIAEATQGRQ